MSMNNKEKKKTQFTVKKGKDPVKMME